MSRDDYDQRQRAQIHRIMDRCAILLERAGCDTVQILITARTHDSGTVSSHAGRGNWFARQEIARRFVLMDQNQDLARHITAAQSGNED